jgi:hypothetical protein
VRVRIGWRRAGSGADRAHCELESLSARLERSSSPGSAPWSSSARGAQPDRRWSRRTGSRASTGNRALAAICVQSEPAAEHVVHAELARIMQHFERRQLRAVPYKESVLAQSLYRDLGLRSFSDLAFLISPRDFERAKQALAEVGYRPSADLTPAVERFWLRKGNERSFDSAVGKNLVELQWALVPRFYVVDLGVEDLLARARRTVAGGCEMPCLSPEDSLLVLCLHAAKHLWTRLIWLSDIAETLRTQTVDYSLVFFPGAHAGNRSHSRRKFLAGEERASGGPSPTRGGNDCGRSSGARSRQRIRRASHTRCVL